MCMKSRQEYYEYQNKLVTNIMTLLDEKVKDKNENFKMNSYINYLESNTQLKRKRIKRILDIEAQRLITINEFNEIAKALGVKLWELFNVDQVAQNFISFGVTCLLKVTVALLGIIKALSMCF